MITKIKISGQLMGNLIFKDMLFDKDNCLVDMKGDDIYITFRTKWEARKAIRDTFNTFKNEGRPVGGKAGLKYVANKSLSYFNTIAEIL
jgi:hypothetical protein